jgi:hypothetical protein
MAHAMNDDFNLGDFVNDQVVADGNPTNLGVRVVAPMYGASAIRAAVASTRATSLAAASGFS